MSKTYVPADYRPALNLYETQTAIGRIKSLFERELARALNLKRVSAPLFVDPATGLNDDLNGIERPVSFDIPEAKREAQVVHSLAKWKRMALHKYGFKPGEGLYTDMNAIRRDEELDNLHSIYVDQWDWEKVINRKSRSMDYLQSTVRSIIFAICNTLEQLQREFPQVSTVLSRDISFITTQELEDMYPALTSKERENAYVKEHPTTFITQIGDVLKSGQKHDGRAPDYDDWSLNGDILFWDEILGQALEISSMGIRVDEAALDSQLKKADCDNRRGLSFHQALLKGELPYTIGGGIGQSRLCMLMLEKAHIGEVQVSLWDADTIETCSRSGIVLL